ncbi:hypothetical protein GCM10020219_009190 [Nonomuraea dietziae]
MLPAVKPAKSLASQPEVEPGVAGGGSTTSTACTGAVTVPAELAPTSWNSVTWAKALGSGAVRLSTGGVL